MEFNLLTCFIIGIILGMFIVLVAYFLTKLQERFMGLMDKAIAETVKENKTSTSIKTSKMENG